VRANGTATSTNPVQVGMKYDTLVVGSGISGLCASLALARHGQRVALIEQAEYLAPLLRRFNRGGWWCDPGVHYVGGMHSSGPLAVIFRYLGLYDEIRTTPLNPDAYDIVHAHAAEPILFPTGLSRVKEALSSRYPHSREAVSAYLDQVNAVHHETPFLSFDLPVETLMARKPLFGESLTSFLTRHGADAALVEMLSRYGALLYGSAGHECPFTVHAMVLGSFYYSAHSFRRGGDEVVDAFERGLCNAGVDVYSGRAVVALELDHHRHVRGAVVEGGDRLAGDSCICTVHPHLLLDLLPPGSVHPAFAGRIRNLEDTFGAMGVFLEVDDLPAELVDSNVYYADGEPGAVSEDAGLAAMVCPRSNLQGERNSLCLVRPCTMDLPLWEACGRLGQRPEAYEAFKRREVDRTLDLFYRRFPSQRNRCRVLESATPCTYYSYTGTMRGAVYGAKQSTVRTPLRARTPVGGLFLAGQSVLAPGLLGAMISSLLAVCRILGPEPVWSELQRCR